MSLQWIIPLFQIYCQYSVCNVIFLNVISEQPLDPPSLVDQVPHIIVITSYFRYQVLLPRCQVHKASEQRYITWHWCQLLPIVCCCCLFVNISVESVWTSPPYCGYTYLNSIIGSYHDNPPPSIEPCLTKNIWSTHSCKIFNKME